MKEQVIVAALVACVAASAVGGFGAPFLCRGAGPDCSDRFRQATSNALAAAGVLGTLLARMGQ